MAITAWSTGCWRSSAPASHTMIPGCMPLRLPTPDPSLATPSWPSQTSGDISPHQGQSKWLSEDPISRGTRGLWSCFFYSLFMESISHFILLCSLFHPTNTQSHEGFVTLSLMLNSCMTVPYHVKQEAISFEAMHPTPEFSLAQDDTDWY